MACDGLKELDTESRAYADDDVAAIFRGARRAEGVVMDAARFRRLIVRFGSQDFSPSQDVPDRDDLIAAGFVQAITGAWTLIVVRVIDGADDAAVSHDGGRLQVVAGDAQTDEIQQVLCFFHEATGC